MAKLSKKKRYALHKNAILLGPQSLKERISILHSSVDIDDQQRVITGIVYKPC